MTAFEIQPFQPEDREEVLDLWRRSEGIGLNETDTPEGLLRFLNHNPGLSHIARCEGRLVGAALCGFDGRRGYLHHLAVDSDFRRKGIGRAIALRCLEELLTRGIERCNLFVFDENAQAAEFWKTLGWELKSWKIMQRPTK